MGLGKFGGAGLFALLAGILLGACSGKTTTLEDWNGGGASGRAGTAGTQAVAGQAGSGATAGQAGSGATAGQAGSGQAGSGAPAVEKTSGAGKLELPPPPDDSCQRFNVTVGDCPNSECLTLWPCSAATLPTHHESDASNSKWWWCGTSTAERCITSFDCAAAEVAAGGNDLIFCLGDQYPCASDGDCSTEIPFCVIDEHYVSGHCRMGRAGDTCREDDDCLPGNQCIAIREDGKRACTAGLDAHTSLCNVDTECKNQRCFHASTSLAVGICSSGKPGAPCFIDNGICLGDARCLPVLSLMGPDTRLCSSGNIGDPCYADSDCKSHHCPTARDSVCTEGAPGEPCFEAADCADGFCGPVSRSHEGVFRCTTGEAGEPCLTAADCKSKQCQPAGDIARYTHVCGA